MKTFREKILLRLLGLALVFCVLFGGGVVWAEEGNGDLQMRNGHEGDPNDGLDMVSGGGGTSPDQPSLVFSLDGQVFIIGHYYFQIAPDFRDGRIIWVLTIMDSRGDWK